MLKCEGYKMFSGSAVIRPKNPKFPPQTIKGTWLYKPEYDCWYVNGSSYMAEIVTDFTEEPSGADLIAELEIRLDALKDIVAYGGNEQEIRGIVSNVEKWIAGVKARAGV